MYIHNIYIYIFPNIHIYAYFQIDVIYIDVICINLNSLLVYVATRDRHGFS